MDQFRGTTIVSVRRNGKVAIAGDGQVSMGSTVMKGNARKVRPLASGRVLAGFAGGETAVSSCDQVGCQISLLDGLGSARTTASVRSPSRWGGCTSSRLDHGLKV